MPAEGFSKFHDPMNTLISIRIWGHIQMWGTKLNCYRVKQNICRDHVAWQGLGSDWSRMLKMFYRRWTWRTGHSQSQGCRTYGCSTWHPWTCHGPHNRSRTHHTLPWPSWSHILPGKQCCPRLVRRYHGNTHFSSNQRATFVNIGAQWSIIHQFINNFLEETSVSSSSR